MTNIHTSSLIVPSPHVLLHVLILTSVCNYILFGLLVLHPNKCNLAKIQNEYMNVYYPNITPIHPHATPFFLLLFGIGAVSVTFLKKAFVAPPLCCIKLDGEGPCLDVGINIVSLFRDLLNSLP